MKKYLGLALLLLIALPASAATLVSGDAYSLGAEERVVDNLYGAGGTLSIAGSVAGDAIVAGGTIIVSGGIGEDLHAAGGTISILGPVGDDVRVAGGDITVAGSVAGDLVVFGGTVNVLDGAVIGGDVIIFGGAVALDGVVRGSVRIAGGQAIVRGETGALAVEADTVVLAGALVHGDLTYSSPQEAAIDEATVIEGETAYTDTTPAAGSLALLAGIVGGVFFVGKLVVMLVTSLLAYFLFRRTAEAVGKESVASFGRSVLWGFVSLVTIPILSALLIVTILGSFLGVLGLVGYALLLLIASVYGGIVAGAMLSRALVREARVTVPWIILGTLFLQFVVLIPFVGWIIAFLIFLTSLGIAVRALSRHIDAVRADAVPPEA